jgi:hypothetical protein
MQDIKTEDLDSVTGGTTTQGPGLVPPTSSSSSSTGCTSDALMTSLNSISSSIKDLSKNKNQGLFGGDGLLFLGMALAMRGREDTNTVYVNGGGGCGHSGGGFSFHARW